MATCGSDQKIIIWEKAKGQWTKKSEWKVSSYCCTQSRRIVDPYTNWHGRTLPSAAFLPPAVSTSPSSSGQNRQALATVPRQLTIE